MQKAGKGPMAEIIILAPAMMTVYQPTPKAITFWSQKTGSLVGMIMNSLLASMKCTAHPGRWRPTMCGYLDHECESAANWHYIATNHVLLKKIMARFRWIRDMLKCIYLQAQISENKTVNTKLEDLVEEITPSDARMTNWSFSVSDQWKNSGTEMTP